MDKIVRFLIVFGFIFLFNLIFVVFNKKKVNKIFDSYGALIIKAKFKVNFENINKKKFALIISIADSFICATAYVVLTLFENVYLGFFVAAIALIILILVFYFLIGYFYKKKEGKTNV